MEEKGKGSGKKNISPVIMYKLLPSAVLTESKLKNWKFSGKIPTGHQRQGEKGGKGKIYGNKTNWSEKKTGKTTGLSRCGPMHDRH